MPHDAAATSTLAGERDRLIFSAMTEELPPLPEFSDSHAIAWKEFLGSGTTVALVVAFFAGEILLSRFGLLLAIVPQALLISTVSAGMISRFSNAVRDRPLRARRKWDRWHEERRMYFRERIKSLPPTDAEQFLEVRQNLISLMGDGIPDPDSRELSYLTGFDRLGDKALRIAAATGDLSPLIRVVAFGKQVVEELPAGLSPMDAVAQEFEREDFERELESMQLDHEVSVAVSRRLRCD